jgi:CrcB protein
VNLDRRELAAIYAGGTLGALARVAIGRAVAAPAGHWPWATLAINVSGSFLLGYFATRLQERLPQSTYRRPLLGTGFCGAYTTFSTVQIEILTMFDRGDVALAVAYGVTSVATGFGAVWVATALVRRVRIVMPGAAR